MKHKLKLILTALLFFSVAVFASSCVTAPDGTRSPDIETIETIARIVVKSKIDGSVKLRVTEFSPHLDRFAEVRPEEAPPSPDETYSRDGEESVTRVCYHPRFAYPARCLIQSSPPEL